VLGPADPADLVSGPQSTNKPIFNLHQIVSHHHLTTARPAIDPSHCDLLAGLSRI
jgi:hypothetical protein